MQDTGTIKGDLLAEKQTNINAILEIENPLCECGHDYIHHYKKRDDNFLSLCTITKCDCVKFKETNEITHIKHWCE